MPKKVILTKFYIKTKFILVIGAIKGNFWDQKSAWVIIDFFRANLSDLEYFENRYQKLNLGGIFITKHKFPIKIEKDYQI